MGQQGQSYIKSLGKALHVVGHQKWGDLYPIVHLNFSCQWSGSGYSLS